MSLSTLSTTLSSRVSGGVLTLDAALFEAGLLPTFLDSLPGRALRLEAATLTLYDASPGTLLIEGVVPAGWALAAAYGATLSGVRLQISLRQAAGSPVAYSLLVRDSTLLVAAGYSLSLKGELRPDNRLYLHLPEAAASPAALASLLAFAHAPLLGQLVPPLPLFQVGQLTRFELAVGFAPNCPRTLQVATLSQADWTIAGSVAIRQAGLAFTTEAAAPQAPGNVPSFYGYIFGTLHIGQDFRVVAHLQSPEQWELQVLPADGNLLPALADLGGFIGQAELQQTIQQGLQRVGLDEISIDDVRVGFDFSNQQLRYISMRSHITLFGVRFNVVTVLPDFQLAGSLAPGSVISLRALMAGHFTAAAIFPELAVTGLAISIYPTQGLYTLDVAVADSWAYATNPDKSLVFTSVAATIQKSPTGVTGEVTARLNVAGADLTVLGAYLGAPQGWHFKGSSGPGQAIPIGLLVQYLVSTFGITPDIPKVLVALTVSNICIDFVSSSSDFTFGCELKFPVQGRELDLTVDITLTHVDGKYEKTFKGTLLLADREFDLNFDTGGDTTTFWGDYENTGGQALAVGDLVALLSTDADLREAVKGLEFNLKDAFAGYLKGTEPDAPAKWLLGLDMDFGADLTALPLVGKFVPKDEALRLVVQPRIATQPFSAAEMTALKALAGPAIVLPDAFDKGLSLHLELSLGGTAVPLTLPIGAQSVQPTGQRPTIAGGDAPAPAAPAPVDKATWIKLQKSFGPLALERVGVLYESGQLTFLLDGGFSVAGLTIALTGLSATTRLSPFQLSFGLQGLALDYKGGPAEISGAFLREQLKDESGTAYTAYNGAALLKAESFTLSAIGSYADYQGHPSLFIYAVLDSPLGGPAFFFVTGLAAGFGFNRALKIPGLDQVQNFPLVSRAVNGPSSDDADIGAQMRRLNEYIPPAVGEYFLAVGIRFTTFKIIDSFALLVVSLGTRLEIDLLGLSTLVLPAQTDGAVPPLAELQMVLKASYLPAVGSLTVEAKLTPASFLFSHDCHLTGGFAFYTWFAGEHQDDFAVTLGGYHPSYQRPAHYPVVDKLAFNWVLSDRLTIKGDAYFALVPSMVMAGTHLSAVWEDGNLRAWFNAGADFLIAWKPYHYDAQLYVDMGVSYTYHFFGTHHLSVDVGADLHIWGPDFAGTAHVHLWIVSFTVNFGGSSARQPAPIAWSEFREAFLSDPVVVCSLAVKQGLEKQDGQGSAAHPVVSPKGFTLSFNSLIPLKTASLRTDGDGAATALSGGATGWGVGPMGLAATAVASDAVVTIKNNDGRPVHARQLLVVPTAKAVPVALWGQAVSPALNGSRLIEGAVCGYDLCGVPPTPGQTAAIDHEKLEFELEDVPSTAWRWGRVPAAGATAAEQQLNSPNNETARRNYLRTHLEAVQAPRNELLRQLGFTTPVFPDQSLAQAFVIAPQLA